MSYGEWAPAFLVIGAMKAASTWLHDCLIRHPELAGPLTDKELHFFDETSRYRKGLDWYRSLFPDLEGRGVGESTPDYLVAPGTHRRVYESFPGVRLLASLRDPADRAYSHYRYSLHICGRHSLFGSFEEALRRSDDLLEYGRYGTHLSRWLSLFPREQLHPVLYEDIREKPLETVGKAYRFLGLDDTGYRPKYATKRRHVTGSQKIHPARPGLYRLALKVRMALLRLPLLNRMVVGTGLISSIRRQLRKGAERTEPTKDKGPAVMSPETRAWIVRELRYDIECLEEIIDRDLTAWKTVEREPEGVDP